MWTDIATHFDRVSAFVDECRRSNGRVLFHCHLGVSRSATLLIAYLIHASLAPTLEGAIRLVHDQRPCGVAQFVVSQADSELLVGSAWGGVPGRRRCDAVALTYSQAYRSPDSVPKRNVDQICEILWDTKRGYKTINILPRFHLASTYLHCDNYFPHPHQ